MATEVTLPEMGEEVEDVTISRWLVGEGESVRAGDPLLEIATDKVDTEVPAPVGGTVLAIHFGEGEIVDLNAVIAVIGEGAEEVGQSAASPAGTQGDGGDAAGEAVPQGPDTVVDSEAGEIKATPVARRMAEEAGIPLSAIGGGRGGGGQISKSDVEAFLQGRTQAADDADEGGEGEDDEAGAGSEAPYNNVVPLEVRRLAAAYDIDLREVAGERPWSALTRHDLRRYAVERKGAAHLEAGANYPTRPLPTAAPQKKPSGRDSAAETGSAAGEERPDETLIPHSRMRQIIARNMVQSAFSAPHVTTVHSVDMSVVTGHYQAHKGEFAQQGARLTLTAYIVAAVVEGLKATPAANAEWTEEGLLLKHAYHIGMAVALPADATGVGGLIVPVIRDAGDLNLMGIARQVADLATRARESRLTAADTQGGTFTLTNYGTSGSLFQTPVILQPQVAILGTGAIEKRPLVVSRGKPYEARLDDYLAFHPMMDLALSYDHRVLDGASADAFCVAVKRTLEGWPESA